MVKYPKNYTCKSPEDLAKGEGPKEFDNSQIELGKVLSPEFPQSKSNNTISLNENGKCQPILRIIVDKTSPMLGDATMTEICHFEPEVVKIEDAINYIVKVKSADEWGDINIYNSKREIVARFSYNKGNITDQNNNIPMDTKVKLKNSNGGWGLMCYELVVVE